MGPCPEESPETLTEQKARKTHERTHEREPRHAVGPGPERATATAVYRRWRLASEPWAESRPFADSQSGHLVGLDGSQLDPGPQGCSGEQAAVEERTQAGVRCGPQSGADRLLKRRNR